MKKYYVKERYINKYRNKLDAAVHLHAKRMLDRRIFTLEELKDIWADLTVVIIKLEKVHTKINKKERPDDFSAYRPDPDILLCVNEILHYVAFEIKESE